MKLKKIFKFLLFKDLHREQALELVRQNFPSILFQHFEFLSQGSASGSASGTGTGTGTSSGTSSRLIQLPFTPKSLKTFTAANGDIVVPFAGRNRNGPRRVQF